MELLFDFLYTLVSASSGANSLKESSVIASIIPLISHNDSNHLKVYLLILMQ
jgi:hypothetical protein